MCGGNFLARRPAHRLHEPTQLFPKLAGFDGRIRRALHLPRKHALRLRRLLHPLPRRPHDFAGEPRQLLAHRRIALQLRGQLAPHRLRRQVRKPLQTLHLREPLVPRRARTQRVLLLPQLRPRAVRVARFELAVMLREQLQTVGQILVVPRRLHEQPCPCRCLHLQRAAQRRLRLRGRLAQQLHRRLRVARPRLAGRQRQILRTPVPSQRARGIAHPRVQRELATVPVGDGRAPRRAGAALHFAFQLRRDARQRQQAFAQLRRRAREGLPRVGLRLGRLVLRALQLPGELVHLLRHRPRGPLTTAPLRHFAPHFAAGLAPHRLGQRVRRLFAQPGGPRLALSGRGLFLHPAPVAGPARARIRRIRFKSFLPRERLRRTFEFAQLPARLQAAQRFFHRRQPLRARGILPVRFCRRAHRFEGIPRLPELRGELRVAVFARLLGLRAVFELLHRRAP